MSTDGYVTPRTDRLLLANAMLFIRPSELIPELYAVEIYRYVILACLAVSLPLVVQQFAVRYAGVPPIVTCVVLLLPAVFLSGLYHGNVELMQDSLIEYGKILIYFLLLIALITDTAISGARVARELDRLLCERREPKTIV